MTRASTVTHPTVRLLFVCTGNICRSAAAERLARRYLADALGEDAHLVQVASAGTHAVVGAPMHPDSAAVVRTLGGDPEDFVARRLRASMIAPVDLTLTMTRTQRQHVLELDPRGLSRIFTLREAADLVALVDEASPGSRDGSEERLLALKQQLAAARARRSSGPHDDIADPVNGTPAVHQQVGELISASLQPVIRQLVAAVVGAGSGRIGPRLGVR